MRKFLSVLLAAVMVLSVAPVAASADYSLGFKVEGDTAYIYTAEELMALTMYCDAHSDDPELPMYNVEIMDDIDLSGYEWYPMDYNFNCDERHTFDGNGHTVSNMTITVNEPKDKDPDDFEIPEEDLGFFSDAENADIMNLNVQGTINVERYDDDTNIGGLGGDIDSDTVITNCHVDVVITLKTNIYEDVYEGVLYSYTEHEVGGFVGELDDSYIYNSTSKADITVTVDNDEALNYDVEVGGFIGDSEDNEIAGCRAEGSVTVNYDGDVQAGGIIGISEDSGIYSSSTSVDVTVNHRGNNKGTAFIGGIVGESQNVFIYNSFSASDLVGKHNAEYCYNEIGGIVGEAEYDEYDDDELVIENCCFYGTITVVPDEDEDIGGIVGDLEDDVDKTINNVWSSCSDIGTDTDNVNGAALPDMASLLNALNENARELDEDGISHITLWKLTEDGRPGVGMIERVVEQPTAELPRFVATQNNGVPELQWQYTDIGNVIFEYIEFNGSECNTGIYTVVDNGSKYPLYAGFEVKSRSDVISFRWRETKAGSSDKNYQLHYSLHNSDYIDPFIDDVKQGALAGSSEWQTVTLTGIEPGNYYLDFAYPKDYENPILLTSDTTANNTTTNEVEIELIGWIDVPGETGDSLVNSDCSGKYVRCVATYPDGEIVVSDMFEYNYDAIDQDELKKPVPVYKDEPGYELVYDDVRHEEPDTTTMVPLFFGTTVRVYDAANGTITPNGIPMIISGMEMTFKFIPDEGYAVADVLLNGESVGAVESLTIDGWQGYVKLTAVFEKIEP